ncbi:MAG: calcium/sodium antiporter [Actinobacteria bacterium]|nr:calcium/sodium antiporter [Actinomycetota bacterium]
MVLTKGAGLLVDGAAGLASGLGVPKIIIGITVVSLGTTLPEVSASVMASADGLGGVAAGNAVGSIICNAGLVFGLCCALVRLPVSRFTLNRNAWFQIGGASLLVLLFLLSGSLPGDQKERLFYRGFGIVLLVGLLGYTIMSVRWARQSAVDNSRDANNGQHTTRNIAKPVLLTVIGFVLVLAAAKGLLVVVTELALKLGVPNDVVAVTLLALGTSIPELATGVMSVIKGHKELLVGNVIGANILNIFFVIGASATVSPLVVPYRFFWLHLPVMLVILGLFHLNIWTSRDYLRRWLGLAMLIVYLGYIVGVYLL